MSDEQQNASSADNQKSPGFGGMLTILGAYFLKLIHRSSPNTPHP